MKMKRTLALLLAALMTMLSLCSCGEIGDALLDLYVAFQEENNDFVDVVSVEVIDGTTLPDVPESINPEPEPAGTTKAPETTKAPTTTKAPETTKAPTTTKAPETTEKAKIDEKGSYYSKEDVLLYLQTYGKLPSNFITKTEARKLGWEGGSVEKYKKGAAIGGDSFGNYEGLLPKDKKYCECDIDTKGESSRGAKRIVYATDLSAIYYTDDHYESFETLWQKGGKK